MKPTPLPPELERRALTLVDDLVDGADDDIVTAALAQEDAAVRARVAALLARARLADAALPTPIDGVLPCEPPLPERVGPFRLVEEIGTGGMGVVWRGERADGLYEQVVAIKFLRLASPLLGDRFADERRILARLEHPGIARLIDGGVTAEGVPFLVMQHAPGEHIDVAARRLPIDRRIALFVAAARAVQFAHARLVVHADLKPSNIIVDTEGDGRVVLLDFGIARLIGDDDPARAHPMTPAFASPARRGGAQPMIADDVFALGRILEGLIGDTRDADLHAIAARAAADDEARRYPAVGDLIADLDRWRDRLPVGARAPTWRYRAGRFVARHRIGVVLTGAALLLLAGLATSAWLSARAADRARAAAEQRFAEVRRLSRFMLTDLYDELSNAPGTVVARVRIAATAKDYLDRLARTPGAPRDLRLEVAQGYRRLARVQGVSGTASIGRPADALVSLDRADAIAARLLAEDPASAAAWELRGWVALDRWTLQPDNAQSTAVNAAARAAFARALALDSARAGATLGRLTTERNQAQELIWSENRPRDAQRVLRTALDRLDTLGVTGEWRDEAQRLRVALLNRLGDAVYYAGDHPGSLAPFRAAQDVIRGELHSGEKLAWLELLGESHFYVSGTIEETDVPAALAEARRGVSTLERVLTYGPDANAEKWLAVLLNQAAQLEVRTGDRAAAVADVRRSVAIRERRAVQQPDDHRRTRDLAIGLGAAADMLGEMGERGEACTLARRALDRWDLIVARGRLGKLDADKSVPAARTRIAALCATPRADATRR